MKNIFLLLLFFSIWSCSDQQSYQNPYLDNVSFSVNINMDLPEYAQLKFANNSALIYNVGIKGVIVFNTGSGYMAFEAADPNHYPNTCSRMIPDQFTCHCDCENNKYSLYDGQYINGSRNRYTMKQYHISQAGNILHIYN